MSLKKTSLPIKDELKQMFPTLLASGAEGMQQLEIVVDNENGKILRSEQPLKVSGRDTFVSLLIKIVMMSYRH